MSPLGSRDGNGAIPRRGVVDYPHPRDKKKSSSPSPSLSSGTILPPSPSASGYRGATPRVITQKVITLRHTDYY